MSAINALADTGKELKSGDYIIVDVETFAGSGIFEAKKMTQSNLFELVGKTLKITVTSAQILALFTTPIVLVVSPGAGKFVRCVWSANRLTYNSVPYDTNTDLEVFNTGAADAQMIGTTHLADSSNHWLDLRCNNAITVGEIYREASTLVLRNSTGNPLNGDSDIEFYYKYELIDA